MALYTSVDEIALCRRPNFNSSFESARKYPAFNWDVWKLCFFVCFWFFCCFFLGGRRAGCRFKRAYRFFYLIFLGGMHGAHLSTIFFPEGDTFSPIRRRLFKHPKGFEGYVDNFFWRIDFFQNIYPTPMHHKNECPLTS